MKKFFLLLLIFLLSLQTYAMTPEEEEAIIATRNYKLNIQNCPTLHYVASQQLLNVRWSNPGGGDKTFCYARLSGIQKNHERFDATFIYYIQEKKVEPFSVRVGVREISRQDQVQKELLKFFSTCSNDVWQEMKRIR